MIRSKTREGEVYKIVIKTEPWIAEYLVEKGSVAVDGISLTVVDVMRDGFSLVIIPVITSYSIHYTKLYDSAWHPP